MPPKKHSILPLSISTLTFGGSGLGSADGYKVFVEGVAPGDEVEVELTKRRSSYGEGKLLRVLKPSPLRIEPRCPHFDVCGGCKWQFLPYPEQLKTKEQQVKDALERIGRLSSDCVEPILGCEEPWYYRNKMELSFGTSPEGEVMLGFFPTGYHYEVFDVKACFLQSELMVEIVQKVRAFAQEQKLTVYNSHTHEGLLKTLTVREGKNTGEVMVILTTSTGLFEVQDAFTALFADDPRITSVYWNSVYQVPGQPTWTEQTRLHGKPTLTEALILENGKRLEFDILPQAFFQTNTLQAQRLYSTVLDFAELSGQETVFDLYCGTGTIGLFCAHQAKQVLGVEVNESAVDNARSNAQRNGIANASFFLGSVEERLSSLTERPDVVIVDPPRAGLGEKVVATVAAFKAPRLVYVSCNPATFARDVQQFLTLGYVLEKVKPVDMFPHTAHIECVARLSLL